MFKKSLLLLLIVSTMYGEKESPMAREIKKMKFEPLKWEVPAVGKDIKKVAGESGIVLYIKENHSLPLVEINVYIKGGPAYMEYGQKLHPWLIASCLMRGGTLSYDPDELIDSLEFNAIDINVKSNDEYFSLSMAFQPQFEELAIKLMEEILFKPRFDAEIVYNEKLKIINEWQRSMDDPGQLLYEASKEVLYNGHPLGSKPDFESFNAVTPQEILGIHKRFFQPKNMVVSVVGDINSDNLVNILFSVFDSKYNNDYDLELKPAPTLGERKVYFVQREIPQGYIHFVQDAPAGYFEDTYKISLVSDILGGGFNSKIVSKVRNELGLAYSTYAYFSSLTNLKGTFYAFSATRSDAVEQSIYCIEDVIKQMENGQISEEELNLSKESFLNSSVTSVRNDWAYVQRLALRSLFGFPDDYFERMNDEIKDLTLQDIKDASKEYLDHEKMSIIIVGDSTKINLKTIEKFGPIELLAL